MKDKKENSDKRLKKITALGKIAGKLSSPMLGKQGFVEVDILTGWEEIVGTEIASYAYPIRISFTKEQRNNGVLHILTAGSAYATEVQHQSEKIINRINAYFGYNAVSKISIKQGAARNYMEEKKQNIKKLNSEDIKFIDENTKDIKNDEIEQTLKRLGEFVVLENK